jgi:hypothetical protein
MQSRALLPWVVKHVRAIADVVTWVEQAARGR